MSTADVFKYYKFFQADTIEEFNDWYENISFKKIIFISFHFEFEEMRELK